MGKPYSDDLRKRVVATIDAGHTRKEVAELFNMALSLRRSAIVPLARKIANRCTSAARFSCTTNWLWTIASRQMVGQIPSHRVLIELLQTELRPAHPISKVRDAAEIGTLRTRCVAMGFEVRAILRYLRIDSALLQPCTRVRLQAQAEFHADPPSRG
jgi:hypothetical protein